MIYYARRTTRPAPKSPCGLWIVITIIIIISRCIITTTITITTIININPIIMNTTIVIIARLLLSRPASARHARPQKSARA